MNPKDKRTNEEICNGLLDWNILFVNKQQAKQKYLPLLNAKDLELQALREKVKVAVEALEEVIELIEMMHFYEAQDIAKEALTLYNNWKKDELGKEGKD